MTRDREDTKEIIGEVLEKVSLILAPFAPYISENIYSEFSKDSVHLSSWPKPDEKKIDEEIEKNMESVLKLIEIGLKERDVAKIGLKWPLKSVNISANFELDDEMKELIKTQLNVKEVHFDRVEKLDIPSVELNTEMTPELEAEGFARELSRQVQAFRKKLGLEKKQKIDLCVITDEDFKEILETQKDFVKNKTNSKKVEIVTTCKERFKNKVDYKIKDKRGENAIAITTS
jgi:isoleucyl-tRNA synthetase